MHFAKINLVLEKRYDIATVFFTKIPVIRKFFHYQTDTLWLEIPIDRPSKVHSEMLIVTVKDL